MISITVSSSIGKVSGEWTEADDPKCVMTFAHGAGAGMKHPFMTSMASELAALGITTLRFNFPYMEAKKNRPDVPAVAHKAIEAAVEKAHKQFPSLPVFLSGKSFGGRMSSQFLSTHSPDFVKGAVFFGFPLHAPGKASIDRADHLKTVKVPMLFLQGTKDDLAKWDLIETVCSELTDATLVKFEGANHSFKAGKREFIPELAKAASEWIDHFN
jgi:predicted alpha/beta-hydrolase family hydrolase